jgi:hypothetical protein
MALYCIVKDGELGWYKLYRTDSEFLPVGETFWQGDSLKTGYDMMKSVNKQHRKIIIHHVVTSISEKGRTIFRILKQSPASPWSLVKSHMKFSDAKAHLKTLIDARDKQETAEFDRKMALLRRAHYAGKNLPRLSPTDWKYFEWLKEKGKLTDEQQQTMDWYKENDQPAITA